METEDTDWRKVALERLQDRVAVVAAALALLLLLALPDLPYGYYRFLRIAVPLGGIYLAYRLHQENQILWLLIAVAAVILFNPIYDMEFEEDEWKIIDALFGGAFAGLGLWRLVPAARRKSVFVSAGVVAVLGGAVIFGDRGGYPNAWDAGRTADASYTDDALMGNAAEVTGVDALNVFTPLPSDEPIFTTANATIVEPIGDSENRTNFLQESLALPDLATVPATAANSSLDDIGNAADEAANAIANLAAEED